MAPPWTTTSTDPPINPSKPFLDGEFLEKVIGVRLVLFNDCGSVGFSEVFKIIILIVFETKSGIS